MFKNKTADSYVGYNTPFVPTSTWKWPAGPQSGHLAQTTVSQSTTAVTRPSLTLHKAKFMTESIYLPDSSAIQSSSQVISSISGSRGVVTALELLAEPMPTPQPCNELSTIIFQVESCHPSITSDHSVAPSIQSESHSTGLPSRSEVSLPSITSSSRMSTNMLQKSVITTSISVPTLSSNLMDTQLPPVLSVSDSTTIHLSSGRIQSQSRPQLVSRTTKFVSTATYQHTSHSGTSISSPRPVSTTPTHVSRSVVIAGIALGSVGVVLLFFLFIQLVRMCWAQRTRLSPAERELRSAQEETSHPLSVYARFSAVALPLVPKWQWRLQSPQLSAAAHVNDQTSVPSARSTEPPWLEKLKDEVEPINPKETDLPGSGSPAVLAISQPKDYAKTKTAMNSLVPPAIPSPWSWVSSRTSATTPSRFSFDSRGRRRRSDPFDLEGKGFDFGC